MQTSPPTLQELGSKFRDDALGGQRRYGAGRVGKRLEEFVAEVVELRESFSNAQRPALPPLALSRCHSDQATYIESHYGDVPRHKTPIHQLARRGGRTDYHIVLDINAPRPAGLVLRIFLVCVILQNNGPLCGRVR